MKKEAPIDPESNIYAMVKQFVAHALDEHLGGGCSMTEPGEVLDDLSSQAIEPEPGEVTGLRLGDRWFIVSVKEHKSEEKK